MKFIDFEQKLYFEACFGGLSRLLLRIIFPMLLNAVFLEINGFHVMQLAMILKKLAKIDRLNETSPSLFGHKRTASEHAAVAKQLV